MNRLDLKILAARQLAAKLGHINIHGTRGSLGFRIPEFIHQLLAGEGFFRIGQQLVQDIVLTHRHGNLFAVQLGGVFICIHYKAAHL